LDEGQLLVGGEARPLQQRIVIEQASAEIPASRPAQRLQPANDDRDRHGIPEMRSGEFQQIGDDQHRRRDRSITLAITAARTSAQHSDIK
jgi:hypothetical protein